jgi:ssDNA-binding Zn-finger/Zn-ribbon topoisomerase 1/DNA-directed RNA polymerase subunit RPC12/RpoP
LFSCKKCGEPLYIKSAETKDRIVTFEVQCLRGHRGARRLAEHQLEDISQDIFRKMFTCLECGSSMSLIESQIQDSKVESTVLCPIHGRETREFPRKFLPAVELLIPDVDSERAIMDSFRCPQCGLVYAVSDIEYRDGVFETEVRCANGHRATRYLPKSIDEGLLKKILQRVVHCDKCGLPGTIANVEKRRDKVRISTSCPVHGIDKKEIPSNMMTLLEESVSEIPEDAVVKATLTSSHCTRPLSIRSIEEAKTGYKLKCNCPGESYTTERILPITWNESVTDRIVRALLSCDECGQLTHILGHRRSRKKTSFKITCPIHGVMSREVSPEVYDIIAAHEPKIDRLPSMIRSMSCEKCSMPLSVRDVEERRGLIEFDVECRNGHRSKRLFVPGLAQATLVDLYKQLYQCPECYEQLDLVYIESRGREDRVVLLCSLHGKYILDIPPDHAEAMQTAYQELEADKAHPPVEAPEPEEPVSLEAEMSSPRQSDDGVEVLRGCEIIGGKFDYKVKIKNDSGYVITNVTVSIVAYPLDCMELAGESVKTISRIEVGGFRSPQFTFYPTKDCVQGKIVATVSYIDFMDQLHTVSVEPYLIRSVCDLLKPSKQSSKQFDLILSGLESTEQEQVLDWNAQVLFTKAEKILPAKNFHVVDTEEHVVKGEFIGTIRGFAEGKYTKQKVAVVVLICGPENGRHSTVKVEALGEDVAMLPTTIDELADTMDSWVCLRCGAPLSTEQVETLGKRTPIRCRYCTHTLTIALYLQ